MDSWSGLRIAAIVVAWATVSGGFLMALTWFLSGGARAYGPENEDMAAAGVLGQATSDRDTSFSSAQVGIHGLLGILTASLITYGALREDDRTTGYVALLIALAITALPGALMFWKWKTGQRPRRPEGGVTRAAGGRVEDRLPRPLVYLHGVGVLTTVTLVVILLVVD